MKKSLLTLTFFLVLLGYGGITNVWGASTLPVVAQIVLEDSVVITKNQESQPLPTQFKYTQVNVTRYDTGILYNITGEIKVAVSHKLCLAREYSPTSIEKTIITPQQGLNPLQIAIYYEYLGPYGFTFAAADAFVMNFAIVNNLNNQMISTELVLTAVKVIEQPAVLNKTTYCISETFDLTYSFFALMFDKNGEGTNTSSQIPGYSILTLLSILGVTSFVLMKTHRRSNK